MTETSPYSIILGGQRHPILSRLTASIRDVNDHRFLDRLARGDLRNIRFTELCRLVKALGFEQRRISGSHYIFAHPAIPEILNLQQVHGQAKPYQVRQLLRLVERYNLTLEGDQ
jgi:predicted RNA binding protein YcfA (HicA-like mRNA interferase family)